MARPEAPKVSVATEASLMLASSNTLWIRLAMRLISCARLARYRDRKSTRLNSSHLGISYAVFCLKKKTETVRAAASTPTAAPVTAPIAVGSPVHVDGVAEPGTLLAIDDRGLADVAAGAVSLRVAA